MPEPTRTAPCADERAWLREGLGSLLGRYEAPLIECARRITGDADRARDAVQETFLKLCAQSRPPDQAGVAAWLFTVCRNAALDIQRRDRVMNRVNESALPHDSGVKTSLELVEVTPFQDQGNASAAIAVELVQSAFGKKIL